jgi:hypothetical protein
VSASGLWGRFRQALWNRRSVTRTGPTIPGMEPAPLTSERVVREGGWNPSFARVLKLEQRGDVAFARIDTNGDKREIEDTFYAWDGDRWVELGSNGWGTSDFAGWASGEAYGRKDVTLEYAGRRFVVPLDSQRGWWFVGRSAQQSEHWPDIPRLVTPVEEV